MGRPRKQPRTILTFNVNDSTAERIDALRLSNRSEWANKVFKDYLDERESTREAFEQRAQVIADPAALIAQIPNRQLLTAALARIPFEKKRLRQDLVRLIADTPTDLVEFAGASEALSRMAERDANLRGDL